MSTLIALELSKSFGDILVIENEAIICADIKLRLRSMGYSTFSARSGELAIGFADQRRCDFAIVDIHLGGTAGKLLDGIETARILKQAYNIRALFVTAHGEQLTLALTKELVPLGLILKPYREEDFRIAVELAQLAAREQKTNSMAAKMKRFEGQQPHG